MDNLKHADTKLKELMEVPDEFKDVIAGTSDRISLLRLQMMLGKFYIILDNLFSFLNTIL